MSSTSNQYSPADYFPTLKTPTNSFGPGTKQVYVPAVHNLPPMQSAMFPYASTCIAHTSPQKVLQLLNTTPTNEYVHTHTWNTSPPAPDTYSICNLMDGIDFNKLFLPDSTGDNSNKDALSYCNNLFP
eukprot:13203756-Ditylum_brightwellii.AAC.1